MEARLQEGGRHQPGGHLRGVVPDAVVAQHGAPLSSARGHQHRVGLHGAVHHARLLVQVPQAHHDLARHRHALAGGQRTALCARRIVGRVGQATVLSVRQT